MCLDRVSNPGSLALESDALPTSRRGPAWREVPFTWLRKRRAPKEILALRF